MNEYVLYYTYLVCIENINNTVHYLYFGKYATSEGVEPPT